MAKKPKVKRTYNNNSRLEKLQLNQKTIIETLVHMLVEKKDDYFIVQGVFYHFSLDGERHKEPVFKNKK